MSLENIMPTLLLDFYVHGHSKLCQAQFAIIQAKLQFYCMINTLWIFLAILPAHCLWKITESGFDYARMMKKALNFVMHVFPFILPATANAIILNVMSFLIWFIYPYSKPKVLYTPPTSIIPPIYPFLLYLGNLMKRLSAAFSMTVTAKDLHSFSLCCSCEHHLVVIEQANRIKECIKQVSYQSFYSWYRPMLILQFLLIFLQFHLIK